MAPESHRGVGRGRGRHKPNSRDSGAPQQFPPRKRSIPYGFDFDLDEVWAPLNPHLKHVTKGPSGRTTTCAKKHPLSSRDSDSAQLSKPTDRRKGDTEEFDTEGEIFREKESLLKDIAGLTGQLGQVDLEEGGAVLRDAFGRQVGRRDSVESSSAGLPGDSSPLTSSTGSPFTTLSSVQYSGLSSASSRNSSTSDPLPAASRHRSHSSQDRTSRNKVRGRQFSAGSLASSRSPGGVKKVSNTSAILTPGLGLEKRGSRHGSRGHSPARS